LVALFGRRQGADDSLSPIAAVTWWLHRYPFNS
jgi:hypothetical protein